MKAVQKAPDITSLRLFDTCVTLGRLCTPGVVECLTADNVLAVMDKHDIAEALVHASEARRVWPTSRGNERLLKQIAGRPRLHPVWCLVPPRAPDPAGCRRMVREMRAAGVRAARLLMGAVPPMPWVWEDLCQALEEHRVLCLLDFAKYPNPSTAAVPDNFDLQMLRDICLAHPHLTMILSHASGGLGLSNATMPLLHRVPNLILDITSVIDYWRDVAGDLGPERVVFASGMPYYDPSILISNVQYTPRLTPAQKKLICGDNVRHWLEAVR